MAFFTVTPNSSFHSVQEVFADRPRMSIQGWYHAESAPENIEEATLGRLKKEGKGEDTEGSYLNAYEGRKAEVNYLAGKDVDDESDLSKSDREYLSKFVNGAYLTKDAMRQVRGRQTKTIQMCTISSLSHASPHFPSRLTSRIRRFAGSLRNNRAFSCATSLSPSCPRMLRTCWTKTTGGTSSVKGGPASITKWGRARVGR